MASSGAPDTIVVAVPFPRELLEEVENALHPKEESKQPASGRSEVAARRVGMTLQCWLQGSVTTEQAIGVLRTKPRSRR